MNFLAYRVSGAVNEPVAITCSLDHISTSCVDLIPERAIAGSHLRAYKIQRGIAPLSDQIKNLPMPGGYLLSGVGSPGDVRID